MLKSIGMGVNLNMTSIVEKQVKDMLSRFKVEIQKASAQATQSGQQMAGGVKVAATQIQALVSATKKLNTDGTLTETRKGFDALGQSITEVYKNGQLLNKTLTTDSSLGKDIRYANELYQEQIASLKKIYALKTQRLSARDGTPAAQNLDSQIADAGRLIEFNNQLISLLDQQAISRSNLIKLSGEEAVIAQKYIAAQSTQQEKQTAANEAAARYAASGRNELQETQQAYKQLTTAYRQYNSAVKNGNEAGKVYWSQNAQAALAEIQSIEQKLGTLSLEEGVRKKILDLIQQAQNAEAAHQKSLDAINSGTTKLDESLNRMGSRLLQMATTMLMLRGLSALWQNATNYAQQFYDQ